MSDDKDPKQILLDIQDSVKRVENEVVKEPRSVPKQGTQKYKVFKFIANNPGSTSVDIENELGVAPTSALQRLWIAYLLDRSDKEPYRYYLSKLGEEVLEQLRQRNVDNPNSEYGNPWDNCELKSGEYVAIHLVDDYDGRPTTGDLKQEFANFASLSVNSCSPSFTRLFEKDLVLRTPWEPYKYALSEKGVQFINKHGVDDINDYKE